MFRTIFFSVLVFSALAAPAPAAEKTTSISVARQEGKFLVHDVESEFQGGKTQIRVLLPDKLPAGKRLPAIYVLPVEPGNEHRYGDGLSEVQKQDLHSKHDVIFVAPTFAQLPWYADHPSRLELRQESYFVEVVVPFIDKTYPAQAASKGRLLLGFSKSGWGAWSLLLRHPDMFARAAAWDAPLLLDRPGKYGSGEILGDEANFEKYRITSLLKQASLGGDERLLLSGYGGFRQDHQRIHDLLVELKIPHAYADGPQRRHEWSSGWLTSAVEFLIGHPMGKP